MLPIAIQDAKVKAAMTLAINPWPNGKSVK
jgi:hypothetical protein